MSKKSTRRAPTGAKTAAKARSTQKSLDIISQCNDWFLYTYAGEMAQLAGLNASLRLGVLCVNEEPLGPYTQIALTIEDRQVREEDKAGLTFTFFDTSHPPVLFGGITLAQFQQMTRRFFNGLATIKSLYEARAAYMAATGTTAAQELPDIEGRQGSMAFDWFRGAKQLRTHGPSSYYSLPQLAAMAQNYRQLADKALAPDTPAPKRPTPGQTGRRRTAPAVSYLRQKLALAAVKNRLHPKS